MAHYVLPDLPYDYAALEPHYSGEIVELHHDKHHAAYVAGANTTLEKLAESREKGDFGAIVVHGHSPVKGVEFLRNRINIDTGAYMTNRLSVLRIDAAGATVLEATAK